MDMERDARNRVLERLKGEMDEEEAKKIKPILSIQIAQGQNPENAEEGMMPGGMMGGGMMGIDEEMRDPRLEEIIRRKKGY